MAVMGTAPLDRGGSALASYKSYNGWGIFMGPVVCSHDEPSLLGRLLVITVTVCGRGIL